MLSPLAFYQVNHNQAEVLYNIAIESLPYWEDSTILVSDKWNLYRLSSTRELALNKTRSKSSGAVVYGGLK